MQIFPSREETESERKRSLPITMHPTKTIKFGVLFSAFSQNIYSYEMYVCAMTISYSFDSQMKTRML